MPNGKLKIATTVDAYLIDQRFFSCRLPLSFCLHHVWACVHYVGEVLLHWSSIPHILNCNFGGAKGLSLVIALFIISFTVIYLLQDYR